MENRMKEIENAFQEVLEVLKEERQKKYEKRRRRHSDEDNKTADWSKENVSINWIRIYLLENYGTVSFSISFLNGYYDGVYNKEYSISMPWICGSIEEFDLLLGRLKEMVGKFAANDSEYLFAPATYVELDAYVGKAEKFGVAVIKSKGYEKYVQSLRDYYANVINDRKEFEDIEYFYFESVLWGLHRFVDELGYEELKQFVTKVYDMSRGEFDGDSIRFKMQIFLQQLCFSIKDKTGGILNEEEQDFFNFSGHYLLIEGNDHYSKILYSTSADCGNEVALEKLGKKKKSTKDSAAKKTKKKDEREMMEEILHQYITVAGDDRNIEDICPEEFITEGFRSDDAAIAINAIKYPELHPLMRAAVETVITATEKGYNHIWENGEEQVGGAIARELALHNKEDIELYARYVSTNDMDHPVYQYDDMDAIVKKWGVNKDVYPIMAVNGLINPGQHGDEFIDEYKEQLLKLFEDSNEANDFIRVCAKACIEGWYVHNLIEHCAETLDPLFSELFGTPYFEDFYEENDDYEPGEEYSASARGFIATVLKGKYPTYEYLMSLEEKE